MCQYCNDWTIIAYQETILWLCKQLFFQIICCIFYLYGNMFSLWISKHSIVNIFIITDIIEVIFFLYLHLCCFTSNTSSCPSSEIDFSSVFSNLVPPCLIIDNFLLSLPSQIPLLSLVIFVFTSVCVGK